MLATGTCVLAFPVLANVMVGGEAMYPDRTIVQNAVNSKDHTTLVAAVQAAGLVDVLNGEGPFTVFAPVNAAFDALPAGTVENLLQPENKAMLTHVLTYHVVPMRLTYLELQSIIQASGGTAELTTVSGDTLTATMNGPVNILLRDENGGVANITIYDVMQSNGVIHSIDRVLLPN
ncbi:MAG: fasciclin domain-containing protein [Alphaproteobacteria bacterium]